jgi:hypothetical protein
LYRPFDLNVTDDKIESVDISELCEDPVDLV